MIGLSLYYNKAATLSVVRQSAQNITPQRGRLQISAIQRACFGIILTNPGIMATWSGWLITTKRSGEAFSFLADTFTPMGLLTPAAAGCLLSFIEQLSPARVCRILWAP